ncbi:hypothetical protein [Roseovarius sp. MMSF_3281]|uniref:hypothetical protein n=1 Tax=Roseovarius sp. MMSF_3281 TaxID=3046694 RepID=UPI00273ED38A|nr:hypothetical protein [Roseovarius sp. MMSF_3281]
MDGSFVTFTGLSALFVFGASQLWDLTREHRKSQRATQSYIRALFAEIDFNTADLHRFNESTIATSVLIKAFQRNNGLIPHISDASHTIVYSTNLARLSDLPNGLIRDVVEFYGDLAKIRESVAGLEKESFKTISPEGKVNVIEGLYRRSISTEGLGESLLNKFGEEFSDLSLRRKEHCHDEDHLSERLADLAEKIQAARRRHDLPL